MMNDSNKIAKLLVYVQAKQRVCPQPQQWNALWEMLPGKRETESVGNLHYHSYSLHGVAPSHWRNSYGFENTLNMQISI